MASFNMTGMVIEQIESLGLRVNVVFLGDNLLRTVQYLETHSKEVAQGTSSYLLFHYSPSRLTSKFDLTPVKFELCDYDSGGHPHHQGLHHHINTSSPNCLYNYNRFAKVRPINKQSFT